MKKFYLLCLFAIITLSACNREKKVWNGEPFGNYPSTEDLLQKYFDPFVKDALRFQHITYENGKRDTIILDKKDLPIKKIRKVFEATDIKKEEFDKKYSIDFISDSEMGSFTMQHSALASDLHVRSLIILTNGADREMRSLYIETDDPGFISSKKETIVLIPENMIQIQTSSSGLFSSEKKTIETYLLLD